VVSSDKLFHSATLPLTKPVPEIVIVTDGLPTGAEEGLMDEITGAGVEGAMIEIEKLCGADTLPNASLAVTLKLKGLPTAVVGSPLIWLLTASSVSPGGSEPEANFQAYNPTPPVAVNGPCQ
jgi:hypothetical protein